MLADRLVRKSLSYSKHLRLLRAASGWEDWIYTLTRKVEDAAGAAPSWSRSAPRACTHTGHGRRTHRSYLDSERAVDDCRSSHRYQHKIERLPTCGSSGNELRMMVPLLKFYPHYCPYEVLLAHISSNVVTEASIAHCRQRLQEAQQRGTWQEELRSLRRALSSLRSKLEHFDLGISNLRESGPSLISLTSHSPSRSSS